MHIVCIATLIITISQDDGLRLRDLVHIKQMGALKGRARMYE